MAKRKYDNNPEYDKWRKAVRKRDKATCQMPNCRKRNVVCHHIMMWAHYPHLRYEPSNGICLCRGCHKRVTGQEGLWAPLFQSIVNGKRK